jgi:hypothetical protein
VLIPASNAALDITDIPAQDYLHDDGDDAGLLGCCIIIHAGRVMYG